MERNVVHEKKGLFVASGRGFRRGFFEKRLFENANGLEEPIWKNLPRVFLCECLLIRVSRVRTPDRAVEIAVFADIASRGDGGFFRVAMSSAEKERIDAGKCLHFPASILFIFHAANAATEMKRSGIEVSAANGRSHAANAVLALLPVE